MDLSKEYIKMCDCSEIQGHKIEEGDYGFYNNEASLITYQADYDQLAMCHQLLSGSDKVIWLPRQDQLQEMLEEGFDIIFGDFYRFASAEEEEHDEALKYKSYEQLWLVFVMWEKHRMSWTGSEWVRAHWTKEEEKMIKEDKRQPIILKGLI